MGLIDMLLGRAKFLRDKGRIKSPGIMEEAADALERLKGYAKHGPMCLTLGKDDCRCGLTALLKEIEGHD